MTVAGDRLLGSEQQDLIDAVERVLVEGDLEGARKALRLYLFAELGARCQGSVADAISALAEHPGGREWPAAVVLRAIAVPGLIPENARNGVARFAVQLIEGALPGLQPLIGLAPKLQTFEKFARFETVHSLVLERIEPLRRSYKSIDSLLASKADIMSGLRHSLVKLYCRPYRLGEITDAVDALIARVARVQRMEGSLADDVDACQREIESLQAMAAERPSFLTTDNLFPFLDHAARVLDELLAGARAKFRCELRRATDSVELTKRYPLHEEERRLRIVVPMINTGPGTATSVTARIASSSENVMLEDIEVSLGAVAPGEFSIPFEVTVVEPCDSFSSEVHLTWRELGTHTPSEDIFEVRVFAQRADIDWSKYKYLNPYVEAPASGGRFIGRREQIHTLVSRILQTPMEPTYIDGQKRVGKTSLAQAAVDEAIQHDPCGKLHKLYILWGNLAAEDSRTTIRNLGAEIERFILGALTDGGNYPSGNYDGSLAPLVKLSQYANRIDPDRRFVVIIDEFDEIAQDLYLQGALAETFFANIRALTAMPNFCLLLVGGENMPYVMDRQGQKLNRFSRINLTYFSRATEWEDFEKLVRYPAEGVLEWHLDAISEVFNYSSGNPYFAKAICKEVMTRAVAERDGDISAEEVHQAVRGRISTFESNQFVHLWQDGIYSPIEERESVALKRRRVLAAITRCIRAGKEATLANIWAARGASQLNQAELNSILGNFLSREVLTDKGRAYDFTLPLFRLWLIGVGLNRLADDRLAEELASIDQQVEEAARVQAEEIVSLSDGWPPYRGTLIGPERVRSWLSQRSSMREQRLLFTLLKSTRVVSMEENLQRLKSAGQVIRDTLGVPTRRKLTDRRSDVAVTYVDGEGKSGQRYASDFAEVNNITRDAILPPSSFAVAFRDFARASQPKAIVIIDDVVATGRSLASNITEFVTQHNALLREFAPLILVHSLFATEQGMDRVRTAISALEYENVDFRASEILTEDDFAFSGETGVFGTMAERDRARALAEDIGATIYPNNPLGYGGQGLLLVMPMTVPNNTLPILHSRSKAGAPEWQPLFERLVN